MKDIAAELNNYRQSPRKVRLVANAIRGKRALAAKTQLLFITKRATTPLAKLLNSAIANGKNMGAEAENLWVKSVTVNSGKTLFRRRPVSRGSAHPIRKHTSKVKIILEERK